MILILLALGYLLTSLWMGLLFGGAIRLADEREPTS